ncbi:MAG: glycoside hydrolase family 88 protein, partial [Blautia sp.]|nr:glycoside hydrolase family 88 protein [Blautia sp.]
MEEKRDKTRERMRAAGAALLSMQRHSWEQGLAIQAFYEIGDMETVVRLAYESVYRAMPDGRAATIGVVDAITDPVSVGEALLAACEKTGDVFLIRGEEKLRKWALETAPRSPEGLLYHLNTGTEFWADSTYMLPPYLAVIGEKKEAIHQFQGYLDALYDKKAGLLVHMWDDSRKIWSDPLHWGIGNGWCLMAIARLCGTLKKDPD